MDPSDKSHHISFDKHLRQRVRTAQTRAIFPTLHDPADNRDFEVIRFRRMVLGIPRCSALAVVIFAMTSLVYRGRGSMAAEAAAKAHGSRTLTAGWTESGRNGVNDKLSMEEMRL